MAHALQAGIYLAAALLAVSILLLVAGFAMVARPEAFGGLGLSNPSRTGLEIALMAGFGILAGAALGRILGLLQGNQENGA